MNNPNRIATHYPNDAQTAELGLDTITPTVANTLNKQFVERAQRTPDAKAYSQYDPESEEWITISWSEAASQIIWAM